MKTALVPPRWPRPPQFDVFDKIEVNGAGTHPIYQILKRQQPVSLPSSFRPQPGEPGRIEWK